jgi:hypothetical protein
MIKFPLDFADYSSAYCNAWVATAIVGSAAIGAATTAYTASKAADAQTGAANRASDTQLQLGRESNQLLQNQYDTTRSDLSPYRNAGASSLSDLQARLPFLTTPPTVPNTPNLPNAPTAPNLPTMSQAQKDLLTPLAPDQAMLDLQKPLNIDQATLETLPGYQFARTQGLKAVQNSAAARGLGVSGAALKGAATFSQGLADQNYNNYFTQEQANRQNAYGRYSNTLAQNEALRQDAFGRYQTGFTNDVNLAQTGYGNQVQQYQNELTNAQTGYGNQNQQYQNTLQGQQSAYDRLMGIIGTGEAASAQTGVLGNKAATSQATTNTAVGGQVGGNTIGAGNAQAAAYNTTGQAFSNAANNIGGYAAYRGLYPSSSSGNNMSFVTGGAGDYAVPTFA